MNSEPFPLSDRTLISPPSAFARFLLIVKPNPVPVLFNSLSYKILVKTLKRFFILLGSIPTPVSATLILITWDSELDGTLIRFSFSDLSPRDSSIVELTNIYPCFVYLTALDRRLIIIYRSRFSSEIINSGTLSSI